MEPFVVLLILTIGLIVGIVVAVEAGWHRSRREEELLVELDSLRAVHRLSLATWQARQALREAERSARS